MSHLHFSAGSEPVAIGQLQLNGLAVGTMRSRTAINTGTSVTTARIDTGSLASGLPGGPPARAAVIDGGTPVAGDLLIAAVICASSVGQAITRSGWTVEAALTSVGTNPGLLTILSKVATSGDVTGSLTFSAVNSADLGAYVSAFDQTQIDMTTPIVSVASAISAGNVTDIDGPDVTAAGTYVAFILARDALASTSTRSDGAIYFLNNTNIGVGASATQAVLGDRFYVDPTHRGWVQDNDRW